MADLDKSLGLPPDLEEELRRRPLIAPPAIPRAGLPMPNFPAPTMPNLQQTPPAMPTLNPHAAELNRLEQTGSGIQQLRQNHPFLGALGTIGDVAATALAPRLAQAIPGTTLHHNMLVGQQEGLLNQDVKREQEEAATRASEAEVPLRQSQAKEAEAKAQAVLQPKPEKAETPEAQSFDAYVAAGMSPQEAFRKVQQDKQEGMALGKPTPEEKGQQQFADEYHAAHPNATVAETQRAYKLNQELPQRPPQVTIINPAGQIQTLHSGQMVPQGSMTPQQFGGTNAKQEQLTNTLSDAVKTMQAQYPLDTPAANYDFLMNFIGASYAMVRGARLNRAEIERAATTRTLPDALQHAYDLYAERKILTPQQKTDMMRSIEATASAFGIQFTPMKEGAPQGERRHVNLAQ